MGPEGEATWPRALIWHVASWDVSLEMTSWAVIAPGPAPDSQWAPLAEHLPCTRHRVRMGAGRAPCLWAVQAAVPTAC